MSNSEPEEDFAALFAKHEARHTVERGQVVKGRVIQISDEHVFVDVGGKGEAWIDRPGRTDDQGRLKIKVGDEIEATVVATGDEIRLSHRLRQGGHAREALAVAAQTGVPIEGRVAGVIKGGYEVTVGGLRAFCPFSQMELRRVESEQDYVGRVLSFRVTRFAEGGRNIVLSRRALLEEEAAKAAEETRKKLVPYAVLPGRVVSLADFGAFVDLGGVQGLVPMSELSHARVERAGALREAAAAGAEVTVMIVSVDPAKRRIGLALAPEGTAVGQELESTVAVGAVLMGTVDRVEPFGVFVRLGPGQTGLVPNAELGTTRGADHRKIFPAGSEMKVLVLAIEEGGRRIRLSREKALAHEEQAETQAYIKDAARRGGFGMTLGDFLKGR